jgi:hypothetical protein
LKSNDRLVVHAQLDDLERHAPSHRLGLLGDIDHAAAAFAHALQEFVAPERLAHGFVRRFVEIELESGARGIGLCSEQRFGLLVRGEQRFKTLAQGWVALASNDGELATAISLPPPTRVTYTS